MGDEGFIGELALVPAALSSLLPCSNVQHAENHNLQHLLGFRVRKCAFGDEVRDVLRDHMYSLAKLLPNIRDKFISMGPKILLGLTGSHDSI